MPAQLTVTVARVGVTLLALCATVSLPAQPRARSTDQMPRRLGTAPRVASTALRPIATPHLLATVPSSALVQRDAASRFPAVHHVAVESYVLSRLDDNVNRDPVGITSVGMIGGGTVRYASSAARPLLQLEYDAAIHRYTATTRFNRISQRARVTLSKRVTKWWTIDMLTEGALRGSGEDRDVSDQLLLLPQMDFRLSSARRVRVAVAQRWRRFPTDSLQDATNRYAQVELRHRFRGGDEFELESRLEENLARGPRSDFGRASLAATYGRAIGRRVFVEAGMQYRRQRYSGRFTEIDDVDVPRVDHRLQPSAEVRTQIGASEVVLSYEPEWRRSNDPDKVISQNLWQLGVRRRWY